MNRLLKGDVIVKEGGSYPENALEVLEAYGDGSVEVFPIGGGFARQLTVAELSNKYRLLSNSEQVLQYRKSRFTIDDDINFFEGWTTGEAWNGWAIPSFEFEEAQKITEWLSSTGTPAFYSPEKDVFITRDEAVSEDDDEWPARVISTPFGDKKVYAIGANYWCWEEE